MIHFQAIPERIALTTSLGNKAETVAANYMSAAGFKILDRNWKLPKLCEIDIVAIKAGFVYFVEVKYRSNSRQGNGLDYITTDKLRRMQRAARAWVAMRGAAAGIRLSAIEVSGTTFTVSQFIESIEL